MFDTMTFTKILGGFCGAFLIYLLGGWVGDSLYSMGGGHGGESHAAYVIEVDAGGAAAEEVEEVDFATLYAAADAGKGEKVFKKCKACHTLEDGANATGPYLYGVLDRPMGAAAGFGYSGALTQVGDSWTVDALNAFIESPKKTAPGTTMSFKGISKPEDRANLIAYLATFGG
jgi:cytochrome c